MMMEKLSEDLANLNLQMDALNKSNAGLLRLIDTPHPHQLDNQQYLQQKAELAINNDYGLIKDLFMALAHEISQPLAILSTYSSACLLLLKEPGNCKSLPDKLTPMLEFITVQAEFTGKVVHNMKSFVNIDDLVVEETDINVLIRETLMMLSYELMTVNPRIILNLIRNSMQSLQISPEMNPEIEITTYQQDEQVVVHIADNGSGIARKYENKIFDIHFSTKAQGLGMGLGICRVLIEMLDGDIQICNHKDKGACFMFQLPIRQ